MLTNGRRITSFQRTRYPDSGATESYALLARTHVRTLKHPHVHSFGRCLKHSAARDFWVPRALWSTVVLASTTVTPSLSARSWATLSALECPWPLASKQVSVNRLREASYFY